MTDLETGSTESNPGNKSIKRKINKCETKQSVTQLVKNRKINTPNQRVSSINEYFKTTSPDDSAKNLQHTETQIPSTPQSVPINNSSIESMAGTSRNPDLRTTQSLNTTNINQTENVPIDIDTANEWQFCSHRNKKSGSDKIQPIQVDTESNLIPGLKEFLQDKIGVNSFTINQIKNRDSIRIYPNSIETRRTIITLLKESNHNFHTYLQKEERRNCYIIRGLNGINDAELVRAEIIRAGMPEDIIVMQHITGFQKANPTLKHNTLYKLIVSSTIEEKEIIKVKSLFGFMIKIEKLKTKDVTQCTNCQSYFHTASCCFRQYKCVKCITNRATAQKTQISMSHSV